METYNNTLDLTLLREPFTLIAYAPYIDKCAIMRGIKVIKHISYDTVKAWAHNGYLDMQTSNEAQVYKYVLSAHGRRLVDEVIRGTSTVPSKGQYKFRQPLSPLELMFKRKINKNRQPFISRDQYMAGLQLERDFLTASADPSKYMSFDWTECLTHKDPNEPFKIPMSWFDAIPKSEFESALFHLGGGLAEICLLMVCYKKGIEACEQFLGWTPRSGKIVAAIALERLHKHYEVHANHMMG